MTDNMVDMMADKIREFANLTCEFDERTEKIRSSWYQPPFNLDMDKWLTQEDDWSTIVTVGVGLTGTMIMLQNLFLRGWIYDVRTHINQIELQNYRLISDKTMRGKVQDVVIKADRWYNKFQGIQFPKLMNNLCFIGSGVLLATSFLFPSNLLFYSGLCLFGYASMDVEEISSFSSQNEYHDLQKSLDNCLCYLADRQKYKPIAPFNPELSLFTENDPISINYYDSSSNYKNYINSSLTNYQKSTYMV